MSMVEYLKLGRPYLRFLLPFFSLTTFFSFPLRYLPKFTKEKTKRRSAEPVENPTQQERRKARPQKPVAPEVEKAVADFVKYTTETAGVDGIRKECKVVLDFKPKPGTYSKFEEHPELNRYPDIPCLDETRVILQQIDETDYDYIHANKVKMDKAEREFILTQGPKGNTIEDFWKMVFQQQCSGVIMLCNFYEEGTQSCEEFWPTDAGGYKYYGKMFVNNKRIDHLDQYDVYTLEVLPDGCSNSILTRLAHCTTWPEKAVPSRQGYSCRMVLRLIRWTQSLEPGPVTLLCSAGVGRTGTLVAIDTACTRLFKGFEGNVKDIALDLRRQRAYSIHNELQYFFVYSTVLDYIRAKLPKYHKQVAKFYTELSKV
ncbi:Protein-tyrosine phosphatase [Trichostrongylus colubriformis]|uniref:Protein-tyrosine phosphatase n=1 Tax=Trichostrongylus colubriformis TaxID=6319 RepID=A0AAN8FUY7_TRICO